MNLAEMADGSGRRAEPPFVQDQNHQRVDLPGILADIARATSIDAAIAIAKTWGGARLYFPNEPKPEHPLARLVGLKAARLICRELGGRRFEVPSARPVLHWHEARRLRQEEHLSNAQIALRLGLSIGHVRDLVRGVAFTGRGHARHVSLTHCPVCGKRRAVPHHPTPDPRQLPLPLGG